MSEWDREPWARLDEESSEHFSWFVAYRDLGITRSLGKAVALTGKAHQTLKEKSQRYAWVDRAEAWDAHVDESVRREFKAELVETRKRTIQIATEMQRKLSKRLLDLNPDELSPRDLITWADITQRMLNKALGEADQKIELTGADGAPLQLAGEMTAEARQKMLLDLMADIAKATTPPELENVHEAEVVDEEES